MMEAEEGLMRLGIVAALAAEARILSPGVVPMQTVVPFRGAGLLILSGIGSGRAAGAARKLIDHGAEALLSWGIAAGLAADLAAGTLVVPETVVDDAGETFATDRAWRKRVTGRLGAFLTVSNGMLVQGRAMLVTGQDKINLATATGAVAMDMESGAVAAVAREAGIPFLAVRAISDPVGMSIPPGVLAAVDRYGRVRSLRMFLRLARHPGEVMGIVALGWSFRAACRTLRAAGGDESVFPPAG
ncbi:MAG TPA: hypothetical protein PLU95_03200 [Syntrophales bacterium]|nr:hypothetical protein [Syntrophales bacterium]HOH73021.1 hypothetical protein [Syntrophales bacterium]HPN08284.1 hypothetical protein [Syntrophales bacterium]HPX80988.1 hypothetical protein [Syntrophales bacterium]HQB13844.1 hypothetical protein [Syntrophales bacterium]